MKKLTITCLSLLVLTACVTKEPPKATVVQLTPIGTNIKILTRHQKERDCEVVNTLQKSASKKEGGKKSVEAMARNHVASIGANGIHILSVNPVTMDDGTTSFNITAEALKCNFRW